MYLARKEDDLRYEMGIEESCSRNDEIMYCLKQESKPFLRYIESYNPFVREIRNGTSLSDIVDHLIEQKPNKLKFLPVDNFNYRVILKLISEFVPSVKELYVPFVLDVLDKTNPIGRTILGGIGGYASAKIVNAVALAGLEQASLEQPAYQDFKDFLDTGPLMFALAGTIAFAAVSLVRSKKHNIRKKEEINKKIRKEAEYLDGILSSED